MLAARTKKGNKKKWCVIGIGNLLYWVSILTIVVAAMLFLIWFGME